MSHTPPVDPSPAAAAAEVPPELAPRPMTGPEALDAAAAAGPDAFARALNGVIGALEDAARRGREREHQQQCGTCGTWTDWVSSHGLCDACLFQQGAAR